MTRVLLVDDDDAFRTMLRLTLRKLGHEMMEARNGKEAFPLLEPEPPDVVITDLIMPERDGLETIERLRTTHPGVKVIAMSGGSRISARDFLNIAKLMGAHVALQKPFSISEMELAIGGVLHPPTTP